MPRYSEATLAAIKSALDITTLVGEYLPLHRSGSKFKALCPFHDDHNPSLELNPERQSYKCWSCGAGGDIFDFVMEYERVEFPEAIRMLADRAGVALETPERGSASPGGPTKSDLLAVLAWAEHEFAAALQRSTEARDYLSLRGLTPESAQKFRLGFAPDERDWLVRRARHAGHSTRLLEATGLASRGTESTGSWRDRFRGRLIFPIHDFRGRPIGFGGRILPDAEKKLTDAGLGVAKYLNTPETSLFHKRKQLYGADLARTAAREAGWLAVVEGYTDVIAAHQVGLPNVVGTLGTALGDDHVQMLRRLTDRVVLVFDGDEAGQNAADRSLPIFLGHELDVRVLTLPAGLDPCDFLLSEGAEAFARLASQAVDALDFAVDRALDRHDPDDLEGARRAAEEVLNVLAGVPIESVRVNNQLKVKLAVDRLGSRLRLPTKDLMIALRKIRRNRGRSEKRAQNHVELQRKGDTQPLSPPTSETVLPASRPIQPSDLDRLDRELVEILLNEPTLVGEVIHRVPAQTLRDEPLRQILRACYELHGEGQPVSFDRLSLRLDDPAVRALAAGMLLPLEPMPIADRWRPPPWANRLANLLPRLAERDRQDRIREIEGALAEIDPNLEPELFRRLQAEKWKLKTQRPQLNPSLST